MAKNLTEEISNLKDSPIAEVIQRRINDFINCEDWFSELCFCILTANSSASTAINIQEKIKDGFLKLPESSLAATLKNLGYRFHNTRAKYICEARQFSEIKGIIKWLSNGKTAREWLVRNIKGIGLKEASHFLRNVGYKDVAIIDRHILSILWQYNLLKERIYKMNREKYFEIEAILENLAKQTNLNLAELDLYLWYMKTGKVLK